MGEDANARAATSGRAVASYEGTKLRIVDVPVVHPVNVHPRLEQVRCLRQAVGGEVAPVGSAPKADPIAVDILAGPQVDACAHDVLDFGCAVRPVMERFAEGHAVPDAAAIVDRQDRVALRGHVLVERIGVVVVAAVVEPEQHLAPRPTVQEQ